TLVTRWYSKAAGYMTLLLLSWLLSWLVSSLSLRALDRRPDPGRRQGQVEVRDAERDQGVEDGVGDGRRGGDGTRLPRALHAHRVDRRGRHRAVGLVERQVVRLREGVVHHVPADELTVLVVGRVLPERLGDALGDPPVNHPVHDHGVDHPAHVVHRHVAEEL